MTINPSRANRPFKYGANDRREFIVSNGEVTVRLVNDNSGNPVYVARAKAGTSESESKWQIQNITYDSNGGILSVLWPQNLEGNASTEYEFAYDSVDGTAITGISEANPGEVTMASNPFTDGDRIIIEGVVGMTEVNFDGTESTMYIVAGSTGTTFELTDLNGVNVNTTGFTSYTSGGEVKAVNWANYTYS